MEHGLQKLFGMFGGMDGAGATVTLVSQFGLAGVLETFGGLLLVLGLLTRPVAFILAVEMLVAFLQIHLPRAGCRSRTVASSPCSTCWSFCSSSATGPARPASTLAATGPDAATAGVSTRLVETLPLAAERLRQGPRNQDLAVELGRRSARRHAQPPARFGHRDDPRARPRGS